MSDAGQLHIYSYDGKLMTAPKMPFTVRWDYFTENTVTLSDDTLAIVDKSDSKHVLVFDAISGKQTGKIGHTVIEIHLKFIQLNMSYSNHCWLQYEISQIAIDQFGHVNDRKVAFVDKNYDVFLCSARASNVKIMKIGKQSINSIMYIENF